MTDDGRFSDQFLEELRGRVSLVDVAGRTMSLKRQGKELVGLCPFHDEKTPSFTVNEEKRFYHCFGCGAHGDVIGFVMETEKIPFREAVEKLAADSGQPLVSEVVPRRRPAGPEKTPIIPVPDDAGPVDVTYVKDGVNHGRPHVLSAYRRADGGLIGYSARWNKPDGSKLAILPVTFCRIEGKPRPKWAHKGFPQPYPLYRLPELLASPGAPLLVVEGEKSAEGALRFVPPDWCVTTSAGGSGAAAHSDWSPIAGHRLVHIWRDNDEPGEKYANDVQAECAKHSVAAHILPIAGLGLPKSWDLGDELPSTLTAGGIRAIIATEPSTALGPVLHDPAVPIPQRPQPHALDPAEPMYTARIFRGLFYEREGQCNLQYFGGVFYLWQGSHYVAQDPEIIWAKMYEFLGNAVVRGTPTAFKPDERKVTNALKALGALSRHQEMISPPCWLRTEPDCCPPPGELIACTNGLLHLQAKTLLAQTRDYFNMNAVEFDYDVQAPQPYQWLQFLHDLWPNDEESISTLQEVFGYLLTTDISQHKIFLLVGPPRSGKGTIAHILEALVGKDNCCGLKLEALSRTFGLWQFIDKQVAISGDTRLSGKADLHAIAECLLSVSGGDTQTIDRKMVKPWTGRLTTRFLLQTNEIPKLIDVSGALASRFLVFTLRKSWLGCEDRGLQARLKTELSGIFNWSLEGWERLQERGYFVQPVASADTLTDLADLASPVTPFIRERCELVDAYQVSLFSLYGAWRAWCDTQGREHSGTVQSFGRDLNAALPTLQRRKAREGDRRFVVYIGIRLPADGPTSSD